MTDHELMGITRAVLRLRIYRQGLMRIEKTASYVVYRFFEAAEFKSTAIGRKTRTKIFVQTTPVKTPAKS